jgi:hypothetical protein
MIYNVNDENRFLKTDGNENVFISAYAFEDMSEMVIKAHENVFNKLNIPLNLFKGDIRHPEALDYIINNIDSNYFIFLMSMLFH